MLKLNVNQAKSQFLDRPIVEKLDKDAKRGLAKFGAFTRRAARQSMKKARQKKLSEMTKEERQRFRIKLSIAKAAGDSRPKRPAAPSEPGKPPKLKRGDIKRPLCFVYEPKERAVVIGPATMSEATGAPEALEKGGVAQTKTGRVRIAQRPYMKPAFDQNITKLPRLIAGQS